MRLKVLPILSLQSHVSVALMVSGIRRLGLEKTMPDSFRPPATEVSQSTHEGIPQVASVEGPGRALRFIQMTESVVQHNSCQRLDLCSMREFQLLQHVFATSADSEAVLIGAGDDMAMVRVNGSTWLAAVDQLVEARHVNLETNPVELVGRKAVTRSLSDVAAMAAQPVASLAAVTLPPNQTEDWATKLFDAINRTADPYARPYLNGGHDPPKYC